MNKNNFIIFIILLFISFQMMFAGDEASVGDVVIIEIMQNPSAVAEQLFNDIEIKMVLPKIKIFFQRKLKRRLMRTIFNRKTFNLLKNLMISKAFILDIYHDIEIPKPERKRKWYNHLMVYVPMKRKRTNNTMKVMTKTVITIF